MILNIGAIIVGIIMIVAGKKNEMGPLMYVGVLFLIFGGFGLITYMF